jgi:hypothetical protein
VCNVESGDDLLLLLVPRRERPCPRPLRLTRRDSGVNTGAGGIAAVRDRHAGAIMGRVASGEGP